MPIPPPYSSVRNPVVSSFADQSFSSADSLSSTPAGSQAEEDAGPVWSPVRTRRPSVTSSGPTFHAECTCVAICVVSLTVVSFALGLAASIGFGEPCFSKDLMHCDIPECQCGTPQQKPRCQNYQGLSQQDACTAAKLRKHEKKGGNAPTWRLAIAACVTLSAAIVILCSSFARTICVVDQSERPRVARRYRGIPKTAAYQGMCSLCVYMTVVASIGIAVFIGVVLQRKKVEDVVKLVAVVQVLVYVGFGFVILTSTLLADAYRVN